MPSRTPAAARAAMDQQPFPNSAQERAAREDLLSLQGRWRMTLNESGGTAFPHNFDAVPDVRSAEPLTDIREGIRLQTETFTPPQPLEQMPSAESQPPEDAEAEEATEAEHGAPGAADTSADTSAGGRRPR